MSSVSVRMCVFLCMRTHVHACYALRSLLHLCRITMKRARRGGVCVCVRSGVCAEAEEASFILILEGNSEWEDACDLHAVARDLS